MTAPADREIIAGATAGPWDACTWDPMERPHVTVGPYRSEMCGAHRDIPRTPGNAEFIARARTAWPAALDRCDALEAENERLRKLLGEALELAASHADERSTFPNRRESLDRIAAIRTEAKLS